MINLKDTAVFYEKISAYEMLVELSKIVGFDIIRAALDEIENTENEENKTDEM